jgi:hypothetical protein
MTTRPAASTRCSTERTTTSRTSRTRRKTPITPIRRATTRRTAARRPWCCRSSTSVAKCHADFDRKGPDFDLSGCIRQARDKRESKLIGLLDEHVRPEQCFPDICTAGQSPADCVNAVLELHAPGSGRS